MPYGLVCVPSIAGFCIKYTINKNYANVPLEYLNKIDKDFFVDDYISFAKRSSEINDLIFHSTKLLEATGFTLIKFSCNSKAILANLQSEDLAPSLRKINLSKEELPSQKHL